MARVTGAFAVVVAGADPDPPGPIEDVKRETLARVTEACVALRVPEPVDDPVPEGLFLLDPPGLVCMLEVKREAVARVTGLLAVEGREDPPDAAGVARDALLREVPDDLLRSGAEGVVRVEEVKREAVARVMPLDEDRSDLSLDDLETGDRLGERLPVLLTGAALDRVVVGDALLVDVVEDKLVALEEVYREAEDRARLLGGDAEAEGAVDADDV